MATVGTPAHQNLGWWIKHGALGGLIAGVIFALFEMLMAALLQEAFFGPLRMIGATVLGQQALQPGYPLAGAAIVGLLVHMILSVAYGVVFALLLAYAPTLARTRLVVGTAAGLYGLLLWLVNFYVVAPLAGWTWFPNRTNPIVQVVAHAVFFGTALGLYLYGVVRQRRAL